MLSVIHRIRLWGAALAVMFCAAAAPVSAQTSEPVFTIGVLPNVSARVILNNYQPRLFIRSY